MMALAAKDAAFTSAPHSQPLLLTPRNIVVQEFWGKQNARTLSAQTSSNNTANLI